MVTEFFFLMRSTMMISGVQIGSVFSNKFCFLPTNVWLHQKITISSNSLYKHRRADQVTGQVCWILCLVHYQAAPNSVSRRFINGHASVRKSGSTPRHFSPAAPSTAPVAPAAIHLDQLDMTPIPRCRALLYFTKSCRLRLTHCLALSGIRSSPK